MPSPEPAPFPAGGEGFGVLGAERVYEGPRIYVERLSVEAPDGSVFEREVVRHPGAVAVVPVTEAGGVLLVRQFRAPIGRALLEIPAGTRDVDGEPPEQTALRELAEEVGVHARSIEELGRFWNSPGFCDEETIVYLATDLEACEPGREGFEERYIEVIEVPLDRVEEVLAKRGDRGHADSSSGSCSRAGPTLFGDQPSPISTNGPPALDPSAEDYLTWLAVERGRATNTIAAYRRDLVAYEQFLRSCGLDVTRATRQRRRTAYGGDGLSRERGRLKSEGTHCGKRALPVPRRGRSR